MKKLLLTIILLLLFVPVLVNAAQCDTSKVYIDSIGIENTNGNVVELENANAQDKKVNLNLRMATKNDEIVYKVVLKNDSTEDYEINKNSIGLNTDYLEYSLESDKNNIVKANSTKTIYLRVKYKTEVDPSKFVNGEYQDEITMKVNLRSDDAPANPNTGLPYVIIISLVLIISGITLIIYKKKKISTLMILVGILLLPIGVNALCTCEIVVDSKVIIKTEDKFHLTYLDCYGPDSFTFNYRIGMSLSEFTESKYYTNFNEIDEFIKNRINYCINDNTQNDCSIILATKDFDECINEIEWPNLEDYTNPQDYNNACAPARELQRQCTENYTTPVNSNSKIRSIKDSYYLIKDSICIG